MKLKDFFKRYKSADKKGFTLVEMIAVVAVLAITSTATISIFLAVRNTVVDTSQVTTDQFNTSQIENYIRNELQVATNVDIYEKAGASSFTPNYPSGYTVQDGDECMAFDPTNECVYFMKYSETEGIFKTRLRIDSVESVKISIAPLNYQAALLYQAAVDAGTAPATNPVERDRLKLFYEIRGLDFIYDGGMVLSNTKAGHPDMSYWTTEPPYTENILWTNDSTLGANQNNLVLAFHSEVSKDTDTV